eukprot:CAMPEP_0170451870 /NCGR_PEP_ID=MMETSP0123-20130129/970_1 /TAXON_ID=182087 /ORGANISM="Favella ehrenbergii, Strain Fehren 1" /LENGTH=40 /DNA_ID= /DNA_START= /DNA_END= /DNA_ORIENTATION=
MLESFKPEHDSKDNLYQVTGLKLDESEFAEEDTTSEEEIA